MTYLKQINHNYMQFVWCFLILLSLSCNSAEAPGSLIAETTPPPTSAQPVEYGASLSEWEAATETDTEEMMSRADTNTDVAEAEEIAMTQTDPTATPKSVEATPTTEATKVPPAKEAATTDKPTLFILNDITYQEMMWDGLVPADYTPDAIMAKYEAKLAEFEDDSTDALALYAQMQEEFNEAPVNETLNETFIRLPGFIAPLEYTDDLITEFLLVPYFGACIHVPPPPVNQTVLVKTDEGYGIKPEDSYSPIWVMGKMTTQGVTTDLAEAGYYIQDAIIEPYIIP